MHRLSLMVGHVLTFFVAITPPPPTICRCLVPVQQCAYRVLKLFVRHPLVKPADQLGVLTDEVASLGLLGLRRVDDDVGDDLCIGAQPSSGQPLQRVGKATPVSR